MSTPTKLPAKITNIKVCANQAELGVLTYGSVHHYQPTQEKQHVSLTMTRKGMDGFSSGALHPIFAQNLPEGFNRRFIAEKLARYAKVNDMYLLALQGSQGIGMLSYKSELDLPETDSLSLSEILSYQSHEPLFPQLLEKYYLRNSLAGMQPKVSIPNAKTVQTDRTVQQKDLIVKSFDSEFPLLTVNEFVCMQAARQCGLKPPHTYLSENLETYVVERFDKSSDGTKLGYEDFTTLMKKSNDPDAKYSGSYETLLKATYLYTGSVAEVEKMYKYIVFNCLVGNGDAHLKNFALQYSPDMKNIFVSPPFDITHTLIYESIDNKMALKLAGSKAFPELSHLLKLAESEHFRIRNPREIIESFSENILDYLQVSNEVQLFDGLRTSIEQSISNIMKSSSDSKNYRHDRKKKFE
ncbi:type II toxin-antitoxin system HipA family toxin [Acinetobacter sp. SwsAc6]|uniref:type II toxin-antitoxin system HipA family toxin n=1 Tax=Acinetobacter TaxID=469 RepID=UPI000D139666|nr:MULTISPECIES: type II toxin-antitoxin system HipA family toxin [Acinetobacter]NWK74300.1 type II toxin-antitoxin system HipA family toxin [Acinetobacter sp. SwsAc6]QCO22119.1 type II toxin-antitoxin system HipA family toxin [Acinetobacter cumulans]RFS30882.1 type II toxin-antitoxin system HipA family toxin [Acinetobacter sp. SWAC5]RKG46905.1 type II toxin-antitoxin system HipA family toxin [Acinetobacter cumulans]RZG62300.1 type II toxin-antitoxin system HipA family toxin [Acinetobacter sp.